MSVLDRVKAAFTQKQTEAAETYASVVSKLAADETVSESLIITTLEDNRKTPDDLERDVDNQRERNRLGAEITRWSAVADDTVVARREHITVTADYERELKSLNDKFQPLFDSLTSRIRMGESAAIRLSTVKNELSRVGKTPTP